MVGVDGVVTTVVGADGVVIMVVGVDGEVIMVAGVVITVGDGENKAETTHVYFKKKKYGNHCGLS